MKRQLLLFMPDAAAGLPAPAGIQPGVAAPAAPASAPAPLSTERMQSDILGYLTVQPPATPNTPPAAEPPAPVIEPGLEPSPGEAQPPAELPHTPPHDDDEPLPEQLDPRAVNAIAKERGKRRELKGRLEAERDAEKARADALKVELEAKNQPGAGPDGDQSKRSDLVASPATDRLGNHPLIREAREAKAQHADMYERAAQWLTGLETNVDTVIAELKQEHQLDLAGRPVEEVRGLLQRVRDNALLKHGEAAGHAAALEREAERNLGAMTQQWKGYTETLIPELKDPKSVMAVEHAKTKTAYPWLQQDPRGDYVAQCIAEGHRILSAKAKRAAQPGAAAATAQPGTRAAAARPAVPAAAPLPGASASLPTNEPPPNNVDALKQKFFKSGNPDDRKAWMDAVIAASATRAA